MGKTSSSNEVRTLVLVGRTGNGKSSTGNSILGRSAFKSKASSFSVARTCELQRTILRGGQIVDIIDTPGLFAGNDFAGKEIVKCIDMAKDGIHAFVLVLSIRTRFSEEEKAAIHSLQTLFGSKIVDYMIVVFTGGDELEENDETLEDYLGGGCPEPLKEILAQCGNRCVLFDNKTKDERKRFGQVQQLLFLVNMVISQNDGRPYTNELFTEVKVESKLKEENTNLLQQMAEEQAARLKAEENAKSGHIKLDNEIQKLKQDLTVANRRISEKRIDRCGLL